MEREAIILRHRAKRRMYAEYESSEPRLRRVLGHCAVYHFASYIVETEDLIAARLEERCLSEEDQGWSSSSSEDEDELEELSRCCSNDTTLPISPCIEIVEDTFITQDVALDSLCEHTELISLHENERENQVELIASIRDIRNVTRERPKRVDFPNPLRSHPPAPTAHEISTIASAINTTRVVEQSACISTVEETDDHMNQMILRMARAMYKVLINLHPKSPWMAALEEGDLEAQQWLENAIFAVTPSQEISSMKCASDATSGTWISC